MRRRDSSDPSRRRARPTVPPLVSSRVSLPSMHEASLVRSLLSQVDALVREHQAEGVERIELEVGPLSGVEPDLLQSAFDQLRGEFQCDAATFDVRLVPLTAECPACGDRFELVEFVFRCPRGCASNVRVVQGEGCVLKRVALRMPERPGESP